MAIFSSRAVVGLDIGSSSLKLVELLDRRRRLEVATYAAADMPNPLLAPTGTAEAEIAQLAQLITRMLDAAGVSTDAVVAALPSSIVFSTVLTLPDLPEADMDRAVQFAARDVVPANLDEMVLGWGRVGEQPHLNAAASPPGTAPAAVLPGSAAAPELVPIFLTAAPKNIVSRYTRLMEVLKLNLVALEVETFPLVRSLLDTGASAMIVDIGDRVTTYHIVDAGTARVSHTIDFGGYDITASLAQQQHSSVAEAEAQKVEYGLSAAAPAAVRTAIHSASQKLWVQAAQLLSMYTAQSTHTVTKTVLIGGGASLKGLTEVWSETVGHPVAVGNPWQGLSYPQSLDARVREIGPLYAVAVGLAERGFNQLY